MRIVACSKVKDAIISCCLKSCQMLDMKGILRDSVVTKQKRQRVKDDNEEDEFYDRTGTIQRKRNKKLSNRQRAQQQVETYESLSRKKADMLASMAKLDRRIAAKLAEAEKGKLFEKALLVSDAPTRHLLAFSQTRRRWRCG
eukprot:m.145128 g.145128  ORF g.145128 m.145128 type:complete len:142 (+) comp16214_c0_seq3:889-1314(+)